MKLDDASAGRARKTLYSRLEAERARQRAHRWDGLAQRRDEQGANRLLIQQEKGLIVGFCLLRLTVARVRKGVPDARNS